LVRLVGANWVLLVISAPNTNQVSLEWPVTAFGFELEPLLLALLALKRRRANASLLPSPTKKSLALSADGYT
jgi:hypothetical protein